MPALEAGTAALRRAGFGKRIPFVYSVLFNNALSAIAMGDDRLRHEDDGPRDHATIMAEFQALPTASDDVRALGRDFIGAFAKGGNVAAEARFAYYRFVVDTTIAGLERTG